MFEKRGGGEEKPSDHQIISRFPPFSPRNCYTVRPYGAQPYQTPPQTSRGTRGGGGGFNKKFTHSNGFNLTARKNLEGWNMLSFFDLMTLFFLITTFCFGVLHVLGFGFWGLLCSSASNNNDPADRPGMDVIRFPPVVDPRCPPTLASHSHSPSSSSSSSTTLHQGSQAECYTHSRTYGLKEKGIPHRIVVICCRSPGISTTLL